MAETIHTDDERRFLNKVFKDPRSGCWIWTGATESEDGYGRFSYQGNTQGAHRISHVLFKGPIAPGLVIDHLCRRRNCVNPDHLEAVSNRENLRRGSGHGSETHCPAGHPYDEANTSLWNDRRSGSIKRACLTCKRDRARKSTDRAHA